MEAMTGQKHMRLLASVLTLLDLTNRIRAIRSRYHMTNDDMQSIESATFPGTLASLSAVNDPR